jgi:hypothetical protein
MGRVGDLGRGFTKPVAERIPPLDGFWGGVVAEDVEVDNCLEVVIDEEPGGRRSGRVLFDLSCSMLLLGVSCDRAGDALGVEGWLKG